MPAKSSMSAKSSIAAAAMSGILLTTPVLAAEWQREAGLSVGAFYSDNACLDDRDETGKGAATVTPDLMVKGTGARANMSLRAAVEYNSLADSNLDCRGGRGGQLASRRAVIPTLRFAGNLEVIEDWLTLESDAFAGRNPIDPFAAGGHDNLNRRDNTNITYQYSAGALMQRRLADNTHLRMRYRYSEQYNEANLLGDNSEDRVEFDLGTDPARSRFSTGISGRYSKIQYDENDLEAAFDNTLSSAEIRAALQLTRDWQVNGFVGEEWNEFISEQDDIEGSYWDVGLLWTPNERVEVGIGTGERFFGSTPRLDISYRHKRSELTASYSRTLSLPRNLRAVITDPDDPFDPDFGQLPGDPVLIGGQPTFIGNTPILDERFTLKYRFSGRRTTITLAASDSQQSRTEDSAEGDFTNASATLTRALSPRLSANMRAHWSEREGDGDSVGRFGQRSETWRLGFGFSRRLGNDTTINLGYQFTRQESEFELNEYRENRVTLSVRHAF